MAKTLEQLRSSITTSLFGRRIGLDTDQYLVGPKDQRVETPQATSATTGTLINAHGFTGVSSSTNTTWTMSAPVEGVAKRLAATSTSTGTMTVQLASGTFMTTAGSSFNQAVFNAAGQVADLFGASTSSYVAMGAASCTFSTF